MDAAIFLSGIPGNLGCLASADAKVDWHDIECITRPSSMADCSTYCHLCGVYEDTFFAICGLSQLRTRRAGSASLRCLSRSCFSPASHLRRYLGGPSCVEPRKLLYRRESVSLEKSGNREAIDYILFAGSSVAAKAIVV